MADNQSPCSSDQRADTEPSTEVAVGEHWEAIVAAEIERQQISTACRRLEHESSLSAAQRDAVERLAATIVERLAPAAGRVVTERK
ncbi:hypothetical protein ACLI4Y_16895 [Natrialbaceae archaeon A-CW3]